MTNNSKALSKMGKPALLATIQFLGLPFYDRIISVSQLEQATRETLGKLIHNRFLTLYKKNCTSCSSEYCVPYNDNNRAKRKYCFICGQGSHICNDNSTTLDIDKGFEPTWICSACYQNSTAPFIAYLSTLIPPITPSQASSFSPTPTPEQIESFVSLYANSTPLLASPAQNPTDAPLPTLEESINTLPTPAEPLPDGNPTILSTATNPDPLFSTNCLDSPDPLSKKDSTIPLATTTNTTPKDPKSTNIPNKICPYLIEGTCIYGRKGSRNGISCPYFHPAVCHQYLNYGTTSPDGCQKGTSCGRWHATYLCKKLSCWSSMQEPILQLFPPTRCKKANK